jgi:chloride channel protein, CIC family
LRVVPISLLAMFIGVLCAFVALALLRLIGLFTNLFYFGRWSTEMVSPAHGFTVLTLKRSILTEKVARRGFHLSREYAVDPLELLYVREVMRKETMSVPSSAQLKDVLGSPQFMRWQLQRLLPVVDAEGRLAGVLTSGDLHKWQEARDQNLLARPLIEVVRQDSVSAYPDEPLRIVVNRMAASGITRMPVIDGETQKLLGLVTLEDLLKARTRHVEEERHREQVIRFPYPDALKGFGPRYDS